jgi:hypothetical protein
MERLADVDIAEPGYHFLIGERGLERGLLSLACARQQWPRRTSFPSGSGPSARNNGFLLELGARNLLHHAESGAGHWKEIRTPEDM